MSEKTVAEMTKTERHIYYLKIFNNLVCPYGEFRYTHEQIIDAMTLSAEDYDKIIDSGVY